MTLSWRLRAIALPAIWLIVTDTIIKTRSRSCPLPNQLQTRSRLDAKFLPNIDYFRLTALIFVVAARDALVRVQN